MIKNAKNTIVSNVLPLNGIAIKNKVNPSILHPVGRDYPTAVAQLEIGAIIHTGAAVASIT